METISIIKIGSTVLTHVVHMKKKITTEPIDYGHKLVKITISEDEITSLSELSNNPRQSLVDLLNVIINNPSLIEDGVFKPDKIELINENGKWMMISTINELTSK
jgi:hypothetical protein